MATEVRMPQLSDTMHSGKILSWLKKEGDAVNRGDALAEVETDKANLQIEAFQQGTLLKIVAPAQTNAKVGDVIAFIGAAGENVAVSSPAATASPKPAAAPESRAQSEPSRPAPAASARPAPVLAAAPAAEPESGDRIRVSPLARKIAEQRNVDLRQVRGSGPNGRIIRRDVEQAPQSAGSAAVERAVEFVPQASGPATATSGGRLVPFSRMRETIARRMQESVTQAPHFYVTTSVNMREAVRLREHLREKAEFKGLSINHLIIKAVAYGIKNEPRVNRSVRDNQVFEPDHINVGIITAIEDGLLIPVIRDAHMLSLKDIAFEARAAVERARAGRPSATDLTGGTFSISNMGMFDIENFTAIINPGQGSVLAVSSVREEPVVESGVVVPGLRMKATISVDHRIIDGVMAGTFLKFFKEALEMPALLM